MTKPQKITKDELKKKRIIAVLALLRKNSRIKVAEIAQHLKISSGSALTLLKIAGRKYVEKYSSIVDFDGVGYFVGSFFVVRQPADEKSRQHLLDFLESSMHINSVSRTMNDEFLVEAYFRNMAEFIDFRHFIEEVSESVEEHEIAKVVEKERFLA